MSSDEVGKCTRDLRGYVVGLWVVKVSNIVQQMLVAQRRQYVHLIFVGLG
jgi:hypothetical protein